MSQSGFTPIQHYRSTTASAVPTAGNLAAGELALNLVDEKLYMKNNGGAVVLLAAASGALGSVTSVSGSGGTTGLTLSGGPITSSGTLTLGGTLAVANGGTGATDAGTARTNLGLGTMAVEAASSYLALAGGTMTGKLTTVAAAAGNAGLNLPHGSAPTTPTNGDMWTTTAGLFVRVNGSTVGPFGTGGGSVTSVDGSGGTTGLTLTGGPITGSGTLTLGGTLAVGNGGTGATTLTGLVVGNGTGAFTTVTAPSGTVVGTSDTQTLTNKRIDPRVQSTTSTATLTPAGDTNDLAECTAQAVALTVAAPTGTPVNGQKLLIRLKDNASSQTISWNAIYAAAGASLPASTTAGKWHTLGFIYNSTAVKWQCVAAVVEA